MPDFGILYQNYEYDGVRSNNYFSGFLNIDGERLVVTLGYPKDKTMLILRHDNLWSDYFRTLNMDPDAILNFHGQDYRLNIARVETEYREACAILSAKPVKIGWRKRS